MHAEVMNHFGPKAKGLLSSIVGCANYGNFVEAVDRGLARGGAWGGMGTRKCTNFYL